MVLFLLSEIQPCIAKSDIGEIVFKWCLYIFLPLDIITAGLGQNESIYEAIEISADCVSINLHMSDTPESI